VGGDAVHPVIYAANASAAPLMEVSDIDSFNSLLHTDSSLSNCQEISGNFGNLYFFRKKNDEFSEFKEGISRLVCFRKFQEV